MLVNEIRKRASSSELKQIITANDINENEQIQLEVKY